MDSSFLLLKLIMLYFKNIEHFADCNNNLVLPLKFVDFNLCLFYHIFVQFFP